MADDILLEVSALRIAFRVDRNTTVEAVKGVSFQVPRNGTLALVGGRRAASVSTAASCCRCRRCSGARCAARRSR